MARYSARGGSISPIWYVDDANSGVIGGGTEAEAHIIAWALNAVAEGRVLARIDQGEWGPGELYTGPTDGVAPC